MSPDIIKTILRTMEKAADQTGFKAVLIDKSDGSIVSFDKLIDMVDGSLKSTPQNKEE